ncbi:MAG: DNA primase [Chlorobiaceae bacterium]|nr:DNA primase [Chlorobiaceae bacterium]MBA4309483.1 DNA primase [Chlorobiaceae bacterium]
MRIPEQKIDEIRLNTNIVDVVSNYMQLKKRGRNYVGLCPFHNEKTPSFSVSDDKQIYYCFGCHNGGNVFKFLMEYKRISFVEAVQELARELGIIIEAEDQYEDSIKSETEILYDLNVEVARYFSDNLLNEKIGENAKKYFESRNIKLATMRAFGLGYANFGRESLTEFFKTKKLDLEKGIYLGLLLKSESGIKDRFNGRIMFPIFSPNGRVIAFAGRILEDKADTAKYVNSPESKIYYKGKILYGLSHAKDEIRKNDIALLVEGYMDLISLHQNGIKNVVAISGTALTDDQVLLLSRYTKNVVLFFDSDSAGVNASMRSIDILLKRDMNIKVASLPNGEDPDTFIQKFGKKEFEEEIQNAQNFLEYQTEIYSRKGFFNDPIKTVEAIRELVKPISLIADELKRSVLIKSLAEKFSLREKLIELELEKVFAVNKKEENVAEKFRVKSEAKEQNVEERILKEIKVEKELIKLLLEGEEKVSKLILEKIKPEEFQLTIHQEITSVIEKLLDEEKDVSPSVVIDQIQNIKTQQYILEITFDKYRISDEWESLKPSEGISILIKSAKDAIKKFKGQKIDFELKNNLEKLKTISDEETKIDLMRRNSELTKKKKEIETEIL